MQAPGAPLNGGGPNPPTDPDPSGSDTNSSVTTDSNSTIQPHEYPRFYTPRYGRLFHTFRSPYFLPADDEESTRLREQHEVFGRLLGDSFYLPLDAKLNPRGEHVVLDLGCGPGIWVDEFSRKYPFAEFIGIDLVPMARFDEVRVECYDIWDNGIRPNGQDVDVIHARCLSFGYGNFQPLIAEAHRVLRNNGLMFSIEIDWRPDYQKDFPRGDLPATRNFLNQVADCAMRANAGVRWDPTQIPRWMSDVGFNQVQREDRELPVGVWMGAGPNRDLGRLVHAMFIKFTEAMKPAFRDMLGADVVAVNNLVDAVQRELQLVDTTATGWKIPVCLATARKTLAA